VRKFVLACLAGATLFGAPASAAEVFNWTGFYIGAEGGWGKARAEQTNLNSGVTLGFYDQGGGLAGGTAGYNAQMGVWILGVETDLAWARIFGEETDCGPKRNQICPTETRAFGTVRGRVGLAVSNNTMLFVAGGLAYGEIHAFKQQAVVTGGTSWRTGPTIGGGVETMVARNWSVKLEYLYANFPGAGTTYTIVASGVPIAAVERDLHIVRAGVNLHF